MKLYWDRPRSQRIPHDQKLLFVQFTPFDKNVWIDDCIVQWAPTYDEILAILKELLKGK